MYDTTLSPQRSSSTSHLARVTTRHSLSAITDTHTAITISLSPFHLLHTSCCCRDHMCLCSLLMHHQCVYHLMVQASSSSTLPHCTTNH